MITLKDRLDRIRDGFEGQVPPEVLTVMHRATDDLANSGIMDRIPTAGSPLPAFELPDTEGKVVRSADLLAKGPLVLAFYRGVW
jgi:hypothetical protein